MIALFIGLVITIYVSANSLFKASLRDDIKDRAKLIVKGLSVLMACFMFIFQIPFQSLLLQGFACDEDESTEAYAIKGITCGGSTSKATIIVSSLILGIYIIFLYLQNYLYNSSNLESDLPWGSLDTDLANFRTLWKFYLSMAFIFDKPGNYAPYTRLGAFAIGMAISFKRLASPVVLDQSVFYANAFYDLCAS